VVTYDLPTKFYMFIIGISLNSQECEGRSLYILVNTVNWSSSALFYWDWTAGSWYCRWLQEWVV